MLADIINADMDRIMSTQLTIGDDVTLVRGDVSYPLRGLFGYGPVESSTSAHVGVMGNKPMLTLSLHQLQKLQKPITRDDIFMIYDKKYRVKNYNQSGVGDLLVYLSEA